MKDKTIKSTKEGKLYRTNEDWFKIIVKKLPKLFEFAKKHIKK